MKRQAALDLDTLKVSNQFLKVLLSNITGYGYSYGAQQNCSLGKYVCPILYITPGPSLRPEGPDERLKVDGRGCLGGGEAVDGVA